jgi:hypothetical protein
MTKNLTTDLSRSLRANEPAQLTPEENETQATESNADQRIAGIFCVREVFWMTSCRRLLAESETYVCCKSYTTATLPESGKFCEIPH